MAYVNVAEWSPRHVAEWLRGLDDVVQPYVQFFLNNNINGCHLLTLVSDDLTHLNVIKIGHQETILEAVELLRQLHYNLTSENLQSLALKLGCKARSLCNSLKHLNSILAEKTKQELLSTETLSAVSDILGFVKILISWLDRYPFEGQDQYKAVRKSILRYSIELASTAQRDQFAEKPTEIIQNSCYNIAEQCDTIVQKFNDSLIIQPASLNVATVKKRADEDLCYNIAEQCDTIVQKFNDSLIIQPASLNVATVKKRADEDLSPAYRCGKISEGDEIIQVNYQTVVGWQLKNLVCATREHPSEIHLTIKKRPHHSSVLEEA
ncbi:connector enhancer of kinase suppressor of ras 2-like [Centruroides sculpturatus]|uniref:connector enhancer of kinase suppressor of ras 2-like n=1 Tax=Centruroides sculpturatus TaxID=218467 RepID=UPI000C6D89D7|nr:connector enhancer of kinase suppressor of ras 2-like [Centruroides sculpturatus]